MCWALFTSTIYRTVRSLPLEAAGRNAFHLLPHLDRARSLCQRGCRGLALPMPSLYIKPKYCGRGKSGRRDRAQIVILMESFAFHLFRLSEPSGGPWRLPLSWTAASRVFRIALDALMYAPPTLASKFSSRSFYHVATEEAGLRAYAERLDLGNVKFWVQELL